jgi:hypothetical protein
MRLMGTEPFQRLIHPPMVRRDAHARPAPYLYP